MNIQNNNKTLGVCLQEDVHGALFYALPLCVILSEQKNNNWFYTNYIEVCGLVTESKKLYLRYADGFRYGRTTVNEGLVTCNQIPDMLLKDVDIVSIIIENINLDVYLLVSFDGYYLSCSKDYMKDHFSHEYLVYGFDNETEEIMMIQYNNNMVFSKLKAFYSEIKPAFESSFSTFNLKNQEPPYTGFKPVTLFENNKFTADYPYDAEVFINKLRNYTFSTLPRGRKYLHRFEDTHYEDPNVFTVGINTSDLVSKHLEWILESQTGFDYRQIHMFYESRVLIWKRLLYYKGQIKNTGAELDGFIDEYGKICHEVDVFRMKYLKAKGLVNYSLDSTFKIISASADLLKIIKERESEVLRGVCRLLE